MFKDRTEAGRQLAKALSKYRGSGAVVLALPRGGIVLGEIVAKSLGAPLDLALVRKIGHPAHPEYAIGAVAENAEPIYNEAETASLEDSWLAESLAEARQLIADRRKFYYDGGIKQPKITDKTVIVVDDGIATGLTMSAVLHSLKSKRPKQLIVAVPVAPADSIDALKQLADQVTVLEDPQYFLGAVGAHYLKFGQVDDNKVRQILVNTSRRKIHSRP